MKVSIKFKRLQKKIENLFISDDKYNLALCAIQCAEENAIDTMGENEGSGIELYNEKYYQVAYGSISLTSYFEENDKFISCR